MVLWTPSLIRWLFGSGPSGAPGRLVPRWLFLRGLGLIYFSVFYSLVFQIRGLIGPDGILPAHVYLEEVARALGATRFWYAPTLLWLGTGPRALELLCWAGMVASLLLAANLWPRGMLAVCMLAFLSFIAAAQDFSSYQSDGMLLAAGFVGWFFAPPGLHPRLGEAQSPSRASLFLLQWEWFRIYFESGVAKIAGGDPEWRHLTAMYEYYQNGPLPTWIGWYAQQLPHWFHWAAALLTLVVELGLVWMLVLPRRFRIVCFFIVTPWQIAIILTANYTFLNYLVLLLGVLLLDDRFLRPLLPRRWAMRIRENEEQAATSEARESELIVLDLTKSQNDTGREQTKTPTASGSAPPMTAPNTKALPASLAIRLGRGQQAAATLSLWLSAFLLTWIFYAATVQLLWMIAPGLPLPTAPVVALEPFRVANQYGLFGRMTRARYEIEFQGSRDGQSWIVYPFRYKPQDPREPPQIFAPYQPRFDWNLWFASLGTWRENFFVVRTEQLLLTNDGAVLSLFAGNPFPGEPPRQIRGVIWQYWFTDLATEHSQGLWWRRQLLGLYAPTLEREPNGKIVVVEWPGPLPPPP